VKGDGRTYQCDLRSSQLRLMAGAYQRTFPTVAGEWTEVELPFGEFVANSVGRRVRNAPELDPATIESVGITLADKKEGPFMIEVDWIRPAGQASADRASSGSLTSVATKANLTTLLALVKAAGLELPSGTKVTVFAPTNEAFTALGMLPSGDALTNVLLYHVVGEPLSRYQASITRAATPCTASVKSWW
ncbi:MAG: CIA30 family protein, partial [Deltaproteobacteria bacterium]